MRVLSWVLPCALLMCAAPGAAQAAGKATIESGSVCQRSAPGAACAQLAAGAAVSGGELTAGDEGAVVRFASVEVTLKPGATVRVLVSMDVPLGTTTAKAQTLQLTAGRMQARVLPGKTKSALMVKGPGKTAAIATGQIVASVQGSNLAVANLAGRLLTTTSKAWVEVPERRVQVLTKSEEKVPQRELLGAPAAQPSRQVITSLGDPSDQLSLAWSPVAGASGYEVVLLRAGAPQRRALVGAGEASYRLGRLPPGRYEAQVRAVDADGLDGAEGTSFGLAVVTVNVPSGAFTAGPDRVQLAEGQEITLAQTDGLEAAFDNAPTFGPAPTTLGLRSGAGRRLRLRPRGAGGETTLTVEPRSLSADIQLSPRTARWPRDEVTISIRLVNRSGGAAPSSVQPQATVRLGLTPIEVAWQRDGDRMLGRVAPRPLQGPSVIRVEVHDQFGIPLGRDFLEIVPDGSGAKP